MQFGRLGKLAPVIDPRVPHLFDRVALLQPKPSCDWTQAVTSWPMLANDRLGLCTSAAAYHVAQLWQANAQGSTWEPDDAEAIALYSAISDYPAHDNGAVELTVLKHWADIGIPTPCGQEKIAFARLNPQNLIELRYAIEQFGCVYLGVALPLSAQTQDVWDVVGDGKTGASAPGSWGLHAIMAPAYDEKGLTVCIWGRLMGMTNAFAETYLDEAYALISRDWLNAKGISPPGLDWTALTADMASLKD